MNINGIKLKRKYLLKAALFRRLGTLYLNCDKSDERFNREHLMELYIYESTGKSDKPYDDMKKTNGYAIGKWLRDIDVANIKHGIECGDFAKCEFLNSPLERLHNAGFISDLIVRQHSDIPITTGCMALARMRQNKF